MLVFADESGDAGRKITTGSTERFTVALVLIEDELESPLITTIAQVRAALKRPADFEFHFRENSNNIRQAFLEAVGRHRFAYFCCTVDKQRYYAKGLPAGKEFYRWVCGQTFEEARSCLKNARVLFDKHSERDFVREMSAYLKRQINASGAEEEAVKSVNTGSSKSHDLLQLADMVCGAVARSFHGGRDEPQRFRAIIKHREISVLKLPE